MKQEKNPYKLLGLDIQASMEVIKAAYKALMKSSGHPDLGGEKDFAQKLNEAYQILSDKDKRRELDLTLKSQANNSCYILCVHCQALNSLQNPQSARQAKCYQCNNPFIGEFVKERKTYNRNKRSTSSRKELIDEKMAYEFYTRRMYYRAVREYRYLASQNIKEAYYYYYMVGNCYYKQSQFRESLANFLKSLDRNRDYWEASLQAGRALMQMSQYAEALIHFENILDKVDKPYQVQAHVGICRYKMGMFTKAIKELIEVIEIDPTFEQAVYFLALSFYQMHDFNRAKKYFMIAKFHYTNNPKIIEMIDYCNSRLIRMRKR